MEHLGLTCEEIYLRGQKFENACVPFSVRRTLLMSISIINVKNMYLEISRILLSSDNYFEPLPEVWCDKVRQT
jgi:hypothetical protein